MAQKTKTTKTKKLHPGGSVPGGRLSAADRLNIRGIRRTAKQNSEMAQAAGFKNFRQMQAAIQRMTPEQQMNFQRKNARAFGEITARNKSEYETRNAKLIERARRQQQRIMRQRNRMMPTAGISQGRPAIGRTPMPGPVPNAEAMKRMQKLMREQQARFNKMQKARMATGRAGVTRPPQDVIDQFRSGKIKTAAGEQLTLDQLMRRALRDRALGSRRKTLTPAQRKAASDARRRRNRPRII